MNRGQANEIKFERNDSDWPSEDQVTPDDQAVECGERKRKSRDDDRDSVSSEDVEKMVDLAIERKMRLHVQVADVKLVTYVST